MGDHHDQKATGATGESTTGQEDEDRREGAATGPAGEGSGEEQGGQVSEGGSGSPNAEANRGGADSVPDTPDNNDPFERPGSEFTGQSKGGGQGSRD